MDSLLTAAARALSAGDPLGALGYVALRDDAPSLALRGIAMAQLGDLDRAKDLLGRALRAFGPREEVSRARCALALAEVFLASRDLAAVDETLRRAITTLDSKGDAQNAMHGRLVQVRAHLLLGRVKKAEAFLGEINLEGAPARLLAVAELSAADIAVRQVRCAAAEAAFDRAMAAAARAKIAPLEREIEAALGALSAPAARLVTGGETRDLRLSEVETVLGSKAFVIDGCRRMLRDRGQVVSLARRPVLFALARALAEVWPEGAPREALQKAAFDVSRPNESHRARLRVELGRLRKELPMGSHIVATKAGYALAVDERRTVALLLPPIDGEAAAILALLGDGEAWSTSALALAVSASQRSVQRALTSLEASQKVRSVGQGRVKRWMTPPITGFTTTMLLPSTSPLG